MNRIEVVRQVVTCTACDYHAQCTGPGPFRGDPGPVVVVGEAPGEQEDTVGRPFIGPAGKKLTELLAEAGVVPAGYVNTVSCFPHDTPSPESVAACEDNKWAQIKFFDPAFLLLVGKVALKAMRPTLDLKHGRGRPFLMFGRICFTTYHPAAALRNGAYEQAMRSDLARFKDLVDAGADAWMQSIPNSCAGCSADAVWFETCGIGWCALHLPSSLIPAFNARQTQIEKELEAARQGAERRRDDAIEAVEAAADPDWIALAWDTLISYLKTHDEFFVDDLWSSTGLPEPREARALGPVVLRAARDGFMVKSGRFRKSVRSNMTEKPVWRSLIYQP